MRPEDLVAIDTHVHVHASVTGGGGAVDQHMKDYFKTQEDRPATVPAIADYYRTRKMACVVFNVDTLRETRPGRPSSEEIAIQARDHADVVIPFASVDPARGREAIAMAKTMIEDYGVTGFKFHPSVQGFYPNDPDVYALYRVIEEAGCVAVFHTGHTGSGAGAPGGKGVRLKYSQPIFLDDVAVDFPDLKIVMAHPSFPWQDEALSVARHKPNVYIDLSGWSPKRFPPALIQHANTMLKERMLFGTDYPLITPDRWIRDFEALEIRDDVRPLIMKENALRLLGLSSETSRDSTSRGSHA
ncbi:amidohydrolase family protein [Streptomyces sp. NPDC005318]|uniref:amidohydrolase family protein n=1 Tax=Streptomyces sp. NPDC005318 TaxID=3157031 RepID=UPI0033AEEAB6